MCTCWTVWNSVLPPGPCPVHAPPAQAILATGGVVLSPDQYERLKRMAEGFR